MNRTRHPVLRGKRKQKCLTFIRTRSQLKRTAMELFAFSKIQITLKASADELPSRNAQL